MIITISGLPGSGTTSVSKCLSELTGYPLVSAGDLFRKKAIEKNLSLEEFGKLADVDFSIDTELDNAMVSIASNTDCLILEGRLAGYFILSKRISSPVERLRVCLTASFETRTKRIAERDKIDLSGAIDSTILREAKELRRHEQHYGVNVNTATYDAVFNTDVLSSIQIADAIYSIILYSASGRKGCIL